MIVTLIGYRGSGKSSVAPLLAARLGLDWIDADSEIERVANRTIREIFDADGEPVFRQYERQVLVDLLQRDGLVIAAGGGVILDARNRLDLRSAGPVIWLRASVATLAQRISKDHSTAQRRPSLTGSNSVSGEIANVLESRQPLYRECATLAVDTEGLTPEMIVEQILAELEGSADWSHP